MYISEKFQIRLLYIIGAGLFILFSLGLEPETDFSEQDVTIIN